MNRNYIGKRDGLGEEPPVGRSGQVGPASRQTTPLAHRTANRQDHEAALRKAEGKRNARDPWDLSD